MKPECAIYAEVVQENNTVAMVGEGNIFDRGPDVLITHLVYLKPLIDASVLTKVKTKDRRSVMEWEYVNAAGVWAEVALKAFKKDRISDGTYDYVTRRISLFETGLKAASEVLLMRALKL